MSDTFPRQSARTRRFTLGAPRGFRVSADGSRVSFLRSSAGDDPVNKLWVLDTTTGEERVVADPAELLADAVELDLPPEEKARRERAREAGGGIVTYATDANVSGAVYALGGNLFTTDFESGDTAGLPAVEGVFDPRPDPTGERVAYVAAGQLRVTSLAEGDRLLAGEESDTITWGAAEFIAAEEMGRGRGYWWSPSGTEVLATRVDTKEVPNWFISSPTDPASDSRAIAYPAAGATNASVELFIVQLDQGRIPVEWNAAGEWEYLADASWSPAPTPTLVVQTRDQRTVAVLDVNPTTGDVHERYRWTNPSWIELVPGVPAWLGQQLLTVEDRDSARSLFLDGEIISAPDLQVRRVLHATEDRILVAATTEPSEVHVHEIRPDGTSTQLTNTQGVHSAEVGGDTIVLSSATLDHDGTVVRVSRSGEAVAEIASHAETPCITPNVTLIKAGTRELRTAVLLPEGADRDTPLPVLMDPYGGPHALRVLAARSVFGTSQWFANQGYAVVVCDGAGTPARGPDFEHEVRGDLSAPVLDDQVAALDAVAAEYPGLDMDRVGIRGWSFGGYLAALAVLRRPDRFHAAVAGAPVTSWRLYDTHYTERYLGHPDEEPENYDRGDLTLEAHKLTRPLLLVHGLADDNVVAAHTLQMSQALLEAGRPHQVLPLSVVSHMTPQEVVAENLLLLQIHFLNQHLGPRK